MAFARSSAILAVVALLASPLLASAMLRQPFSQTKFGRSLAAGETMPRLGANFTYYTFENKLDHFDPLNTATYKQRYAVDASAWSPGGPIFIFLSGEGTLAVVLCCRTHFAHLRRPGWRAHCVSRARALAPWSRLCSPHGVLRVPGGQRGQLGSPLRRAVHFAGAPLLRRKQPCARLLYRQHALLVVASGVCAGVAAGMASVLAADACFLDAPRDRRLLMLRSSSWSTTKRLSTPGTGWCSVAATRAPSPPGSVPSTRTWCVPRSQLCSAANTG